jgi:hypothetical protein
MGQATPRQVSKFLRAKRHIDGPVAKSVEKTIILSNFAKKVQVFSDNHDLGFEIWNDKQTDDIKKLTDNYNRLSRVMSKVELGTYGVRFVGDDFDVMAPPNITDDELAIDRWQGFGLVLTVIVIGALVVGAIWGTSEIVKNYADGKATDLKGRLMEINREMALKSDTPLIDWKKLLEQNKPELKKAGWFDKIFGTGSATMAIMAVAGVFLVSMLWRKK